MDDPLSPTASRAPSEQDADSADAQTLADERKRLRIALDAAELGTWRHDLRTGVVWLDARAQQHYGLDRGDVSIETILDRVHPDDRPRLAAEIAVALTPNGRHAIQTEYRVQRADGTRRLRVHVRVELEGSGTRQQAVLGYGTTQDVTASRAIAQLLGHQALLLREVGEIAQVGGWDFDPSTGEGTWTEETLRIHGLDRPPVSVADGLAQFSGDGRTQIEAALRAALAHGTPYDLELPFTAIGGVRKWVRAVGRPVVEDGRVVRLRGTLQDITARVELEGRLQQSHKMEAIGQLAGGIAHDFNNLLTVIMGSAQGLADVLPSSPLAQEYIDDIRAASERAATLTRQLLTFSRRQILQPGAVDVNAALRALDGILRRLIGEDVRVHSVLDPDAGHILIDPGQFQQVVLNLSVNARDAMPRGGSLTIATDRVHPRDVPAMAPGAARADGYVRLSIRDTGVGMTPDVRAHVFEPFFTTKPAGQGTGLGLATVFGIVEQSHGAIDVSSAPGAGTTFAIYFPQAPASAVAVAAAPPARRGHETVLLVDDDVAVRRTASTMLARQGYRVFEAGSAAEAIELVAHHRDIALLLTDVVMPGHSGPELAEAVRAACPGVKVLFMSGCVQDMLERQGLGDPQEPLLYKPFSLDDLAARVGHALDGDPPAARGQK